MSTIDINRDIQAAHHLLQLFEETHLKTETMLDVLPSLLGVIDIKGTIFRGNEAFARVLGLHHEEVLRSSMEPLFSSEDWQSFLKILENCHAHQNEGWIERFEFNIRVKGEDRNYTWYAMPFRYRQQKSVPLFTIFGNDVTDLTDAVKHKTRMEGELTTARVLQETLLPPQNAEFDGVKISGRYISASECGGDLWYYQRLGNRLFVCIADVTGHGASAALLASAARAVLSIEAVLDRPSASEILQLLNTTIWDLAKQSACMTALLGILNLDTGEMIYSSAAHESIFQIPTNRPIKPSEFIQCQSVAGSLLGINQGSNYTNFKIQLSPGDCVFFYTDGIYDVKINDTARLGSRKSLRLLADAVNKYTEPNDMMNEIETAVRGFSKSYALDDDVTFFILKYK